MIKFKLDNHIIEMWQNKNDFLKYDVIVIYYNYNNNYSCTSLYYNNITKKWDYINNITKRQKTILENKIDKYFN